MASTKEAVTVPGENGARKLYVMKYRMKEGIEFLFPYFFF